jgi:hypothetical protein
MMATMVSIAICAVLGIFVLGTYLLDGLTPIPITVRLGSRALVAGIALLFGTLIALAVALHFVAP